jgi:YesN/AraC family two-component response regulator
MIKLIFIDDETGVLESAKMLFKTKPEYRLLLAESGKEAIEIAEKEKPDLAVLDILIDDIPGEDIFKQLKKINPQINIILLSGLEAEKVAQKAKTLGARGYLTKPFDVFKIEEYFKKTVPELYKK